MTVQLAITLAVYAVFVPAVFYCLWRHTRPAHTRRVRVPESLIERYNVILTTDSDHIGLV